MPSRRAVSAVFLLPAVLLAAWAAPAAAQLVPVQTIPLATGDAFLIHSSERVGMGSLSFAVDDPGVDPFTNPGKAGRIVEGRLLGSPLYYSVSDGNGSGRTLPVSLLLTSGPWAGAASMAIQEIRGPDPRPFPWFLATPAASCAFECLGIWPEANRLSERSGANIHLSGSLARRLSGGWTVGVGLRWAGLDAVDGVEHLYPRGRSLEQDASIEDYRLGLVRETGGGSVEAVVVRRSYDATHRVEYLEWESPPDPGGPCFDFCGRWETRVETNLDQTTTTGVQVGWVRPLESGPWKIGASVTVNRKDHPKIPDYEIMNIPRDPGRTWAWSLGAGVVRSGPAGTYGVDVALEPVRSETWAVAIESVPTAGGGTIRAGERTVENEFSFRNARLRLGAAHALGPVEARTGLQVYSVSYELEQDDRVQGRYREQNESWIEWTPTWGISLRLGDIALRYDGRLTTGTGRPGTAWSGDQTAIPDAATAEGVDFLPAPEGPLTLQEAWVWTHQVGLSVPLR